jgi:hypothetical protein
MRTESKGHHDIDNALPGSFNTVPVPCRVSRSFVWFAGINMKQWHAVYGNIVIKEEERS